MVGKSGGNDSVVSRINNNNNNNNENNNFEIIDRKNNDFSHNGNDPIVDSEKEDVIPSNENTKVPLKRRVYGEKPFFSILHEAENDKDIGYSTDGPSVFKDNFCPAKEIVKLYDFSKEENMMEFSFKKLSGEEIAMLKEDYDVLVVGAGFSGAVIADLHARILGHKVLVVDKLDHVGGLCHDYFDNDGLLISSYGIHPFQTDSKEVRDYICDIHAECVDYEHRLFQFDNDREKLRKFVPVPVSIDTLNVLYDKKFGDYSDFKEWRKEYGEVEDENSDEIGLKSTVFRKSYEDVFSKFLSRFSSSAGENELSNPLDFLHIDRVINQNYDHRVSSKKYQFLPKFGYSKVFEKILDNHNINVVLGVDYDDLGKDFLKKISKKIYYTGKIDEYYGFSEGKLKYRSSNFVKVKIEGLYHLLPGPDVLYASNEDKAFSRMYEYKHISSNKQKQGLLSTKLSLEFPNLGNEEILPMYVDPSIEQMELHEAYRKRFEEGESSKRIVFVGGFSEKYENWNMDETISNAMEVFRRESGLSEFNKIVASENSTPERIMRVVIYTVACTKYEKLKWISDSIKSFSENENDEWGAYKNFKLRLEFYIKSNCELHDEITKYINSLIEKTPGKGIEVVFEEGHVVAMPNNGEEHFGHFYHMLFRTNTLGDVNIFLQDHKHAPCSFEFLKKYLLQQGLDNLNRRMDGDYDLELRKTKYDFIAINSIYPNYFTYGGKGKKPKSMVVPLICPCIEEFGRDFVEFKSGTCENDVWEYGHTGGEFSMSGNLIKKVVSRFANILYYDYYGPFRQHRGRDRGALRRTHHAEISWSSIFKGPLSFREPREDQLFGMCPCHGRHGLKFWPDNYKGFNTFWKNFKDSCSAVSYYKDK